VNASDLLALLTAPTFSPEGKIIVVRGNDSVIPPLYFTLTCVPHHDFNLIGATAETKLLTDASPVS